MISTTNVPSKTPSGSYHPPFKAQDITSAAISEATSADAPTAVTATLHHDSSPTAFNASLSLCEQTVGSTEEALQTTTDVANMVLEHFNEQGFSLDKNTALQIALSHVQKQQEIVYQQQQEARHYMWEAQKFEQEERRHEENLEMARQDKDWLLRLKNARDEALNSMIGAVQNGLWLAIAGHGLVFVYVNDFTISGILTENAFRIKAIFIDQCLTDSTDDIDNSSWLGYASAYVTSYMPSYENISCMGMRIYGLVVILLGTAAFILFSHFIKKILSSTIGHAFDTAFVAALLMKWSWTFIPWAKIAVSEATIYVPVLVGLRYMFQKAKNTLCMDNKIPQSSDVDANILDFDNVAQVLQYSPVLVFLTSIMLALSQA